MGSLEEERAMLAVRKFPVALYVERSMQKWVVRDPDANFWIVPAGQGAWDHREPFQPTEDADLEPAPGHYKYLLQLAFRAHLTIS
jgi:hypothetical protein